MSSFTTWSIADVWNSLSHVPSLGFLLILTIAPAVIFRVVGAIGE